MLSNGRIGRKERTEVKLFLGWACSGGWLTWRVLLNLSAYLWYLVRSTAQGKNSRAVPSFSQSATARSCLLGPSVQQGGLNSRESDVRNVLAPDVQ